MKSLALPTLRRHLPLLLAVAANAFAFYLAREPLAAALQRGWRPHLPDVGLLARQGFAIQLHLWAALSALVVAIYLLRGVKGTRTHRVFGWGWAAAMMVTALSSFFIMQLTPGRLGLIHLLAGWTALLTPFGVWAARAHKVTLHRRVMTGLVFGGLVIAGLLTLAPGRLMWRVFFG